MRILALTVLLLSCLAACETRSVYEAHRSELAKLQPGTTTLSEFQGIMPAAYLAGQNTTTNGVRVDAYELPHEKYNNRSRLMDSQPLWFYFADGRLVRWGQPNDWPTPPDRTIEFRNR